MAKGTQDRVKCNILPKAVVPPPGTFDAVRDGLAEMPFLGDSAVATRVAYQRIYEKHLVQLDEHKGMKVIKVFTHGPGAIFNNKKPVKSIADLDGIKFRVGGGVVNDLGKALGANMTLKPAPQSCELLSSGVVDGVWFPDEASVKAQQAAGVQFTQADAAFLASFKARTAPIESEWVAEAQPKGLKDPAAVLRDFRAEIAKVK